MPQYGYSEYISVRSSEAFLIHAEEFQDLDTIFLCDLKHNTVQSL
jgi:hypothetical protein